MTIPAHGAGAAMSEQRAAGQRRVRDVAAELGEIARQMRVERDSGTVLQLARRLRLTMQELRRIVRELKRTALAAAGATEEAGDGR